MSTQQGSSLTWQARIRHADRNRVMFGVCELLQRVYLRACSLVQIHSGRFNPQSLSFRVQPQDTRALFLPSHVALDAFDELQSNDRIMWRVCARTDPSESGDGNGEWPEIGQVCWDLNADSFSCLVTPEVGSNSVRRDHGTSGLRPIQGRWGRDFFWAGLTDEMVGWLRADDVAGHIMGVGAVRLIQNEGGRPEHVGRIRDILRNYEHFALLPPRVRGQGLRLLTQAFLRDNQPVSVRGDSRRMIDEFHEFMRSHHPMDLDRIEGWVIDRLILMGDYPSDEVGNPEARASAIQSAMIRNNISEFDELTRLGLSCLGRARVRNDRATRYGSPVVGRPVVGRNPCAEILLSTSGDSHDPARVTPAQVGPTNSLPIPAGTRLAVDAETGHVREARVGEYTFGVATGRSTADGRIEMATMEGMVGTSIHHDPAGIGVFGRLLSGDVPNANGDVISPITPAMSREAIALPGRDEAERARRQDRLREVQRVVETSRRNRRQEDLRRELARILNQMFDPTLDDSAMSAADTALAHLRYRLHAVLTAAQVGRLQVEVEANNDQSLDVLIKDPQNGGVELSRIRMDPPGDFVRNRLPEAEAGVGERAIDL
jgi:hypothetical protein